MAVMDRWTGGRPPRRGDPGRAVRDADPGGARGRPGDARRRLPLRRVRRAQAAPRLGSGDRTPSRAGATPGWWPSPRAARSPTAACTASSWSARPGRRAGGSASWTRRWSTSCAGMHGEVIVLGASSWRVAEITPRPGDRRAGPGRAGQAPVLEGRRGRAGRSSWAGRSAPSSASVEDDLGRGATGRAARVWPACASGHDLDALAAENLRRLPRGRARGAGRPPDRPADRRRALPRRARRLAGLSSSRRSAAGSTRRGRWRSRPACASGSARGSPHLVGRRDRHPAAGRRARRAWRRRSSRPPTRSRTWSSAPSAARRSSPPASARTPPGRSSCRADGRAAGRRSGSSASAPPTCSPWRAATARFPILVETYRECLADVFDLPALRDVLGGIERREVAVHAVETVRAVAVRLLAPVRLRRRLHVRGRRAARGAAGPGARARPRSPPRAARPGGAPRAARSGGPRRDRAVRCRRSSTSGGRAPSTRSHDLLRRLGDLSEDEVAARTRGGPAAAREWLETLAASRRAIAVRIGGRAALDRDRGRRPLPRRDRDAAAAGRADRLPGPDVGRARRAARALGPDPRAVPARRAGAPVGHPGRDRGGGARAARGRRHAPARRVPAGRRRSASGATRRCSASSAAARWRGSGARWSRWSRPRSRASCRPGRVSPGRPGDDRPAPLPRRGGPGAAGRGGRPARRRADPGVRAGARRPAGPGPGLPAAPPRRARVARRGRLGGSGTAGARRRADRPLPARARRPAPGGHHRVGRRTSGGRRPPVGDRATRRSGAGWPAAGPRSTARSTPRRAAGADREVLDALWDLAWAGEVTNDTFAPLRALRWKRPSGDRRPRPGRLTALGTARGGRALVAGRRRSRAGSSGRQRRGRGRGRRGHVCGRRACRRPPAVGDRAAPCACRSRSSTGTASSPARRSMGEGIEGGFAAVYPVLRALEEARPDPARLLRGGPRGGPVRPRRCDRPAASRPRAGPGSAACRPAGRRRPREPVRRGAPVAAPRRRRSPAVRARGRRVRRPRGWRAGRLPGARRHAARCRSRPPTIRSAPGSRWGRSASSSSTGVSASSSSPGSTASRSGRAHRGAGGWPRRASCPAIAA